MNKKGEAGVKKEVVDAQGEKVADLKLKNEPDVDCPADAYFSSSDIIEDLDAVNKTLTIKKPSDHDMIMKSDLENPKNSIIEGEVIHMPYKELPSCSNSVKTGPNLGAGSCKIRVRSPQEINELFAKQLQNTPFSSVPDPTMPLCNLPKYPLAPKYPACVPVPPAPILQACPYNTCGKFGVMLSWYFTGTNMPENIFKYELYTFHRSFYGAIKDGYWKKVGEIKALPLPMACFFTAVPKENNFYSYSFIIRAIDDFNRLGYFSLPASVILHKMIRY